MSWTILPVIFFYAHIMSLLGVCSFKPNKYWPTSLDSLWTVAIPVSIVEEVIFRYLIMHHLLNRIMGLNVWDSVVLSALFFSLTHFLWGMYKNHTEYNKPAESAFLCVGLFMFGLVCGKLFYFTGQNILFHMLAIYAVQLTSSLYTNEEEFNWWLWDQGHELLRAPFIWLILAGYIF